MRFLLVFFAWVALGLATQAAEPAAPRKIAAKSAPPRLIHERRAALVGLRKIVGQHLRLYTDLPPSDAVDSLPVVFDAAVPLWADYFGIAPEALRHWRLQGYLIEDRAKFAALGLLPTAQPDFLHGFSQGNELWLMEQPSDYYRRHLLLHEGTHCFMATQLGEMGPGWYMEGMAELLGTHRWHEDRLEMGVLPARREAVPMWGRIKWVREAVRAGKPLELAAVLALDRRQRLGTDEYAWCWALCQLLDAHPRWQARFRQLAEDVSEAGFNERFRQRWGPQWGELLVEWDGFVATLDYGYDAQRMAMRHAESAPVTDPASTTVQAAQGWQSSGWILEPAHHYQLEAAGRYQIANRGEPWPCEPGGVTLEYHAGHPLGQLLGAWRSVASDRFSEPFAIGLGRVVEPTERGVLYLRVNDSPARLSEHQGTLAVSIRSVDD
jgi:hypothetical protein